MNDKELIYWVDLTGPESIDEIVRLTIINTNNNVLFNHLFCPKVADYWDSDINGIEPEETYREKLFESYKTEIQKILSSANKLITFYASTFFLQKQGMDLSGIQICDVADCFRVTGGDTDTLDNLCTYYGYNLSTNIHERTGIECAKAINYCYHKMEEYSRAQGK
ncbi:hypothetical protein DN435_07895 [Lactobacillus reuteri]|uniref:hypothetical protein n=1 Tax=Limosilactobacillus reuteri TaxID=1598 RepID=UPI00128AF644|nr:hypothetical protein [Limosilactobacillus reuteri]MQB79330.1 hypothetical protein [Limosilactobacillus reuteri]